jgi:hypothetical protein
MGDKDFFEDLAQIFQKQNEELIANLSYEFISGLNTFSNKVESETSSEDSDFSSSIVSQVR